MTERLVEKPGPAGLTPSYPWLPHFYLTCTMLFFAGSIVLGRAIRDDMPPMGLVFWRNILVLILVCPLIAGQLREQWGLVMRHWRLMLALGFLNAVTGQAFLFIGLHTTTAVTGGLITATQPVIIVALAWLMLRESISSRQGAGLAIALIGVFAVISRGDLNVLLGLDFVIGDIWIQLAMISWSVYQVLVKRVPGGMNPFVLLVAITVAGTVGLVPFYAGEILFTDARVQLNLVSFATIGFSAIFAQLLAMLFLNLGIAYIGPSRAGVFFYLTPVFTAILAVALLGEALQVYHFVGIVLVFGGVYLTSRKP
jgi:drug/metabolite transporter (DMT)-like permease